ncbi:MerR family transcriptional regulator [Nesterenkonia xinjiangensis]|uniref:DNA-binding transcriptional MerR regulator n=1 Tax=Nesterenkonia xinjiangensis TaxID=225327 RepID=A0A7Z0GNT2_9MICC|nr:MerR family transcriptional regulator [Nesterenkonia xinjiangensis]NYJ78313.1 DNA-binding transcriptional MerR regulator [Nesterenkonia xinjiangensis]
MHIGELAERTGLSHRTIRHYDDVGLLPATRTEGGFRVYTVTDCERLLAIRSLKPMGYSLEEITHVLEAIDAVTASPEDAAAREGLAALQEELTARREKLARNLRQADELLESLRDI